MSQDTLRGLQRGLAVLDALETHDDGLSLRDLHQLTGLPKPTLSRILATLQVNGYARRRIGDDAWRRTARSQEEPTTFLEALLLDIGGDVLDELCRRVIWPSDLAIYRHGAMQIFETTRRLTPFVINRMGIGLRVPVLQSGLGLAWLAYCSDAERAATMRELAASDDPYDRQAREPAVVEALIAGTRAKGYGMRARGYQPRRAISDDKTSGIAVPVFAEHRVIASINLVWILSAFDEEAFVQRYLADLQEAARRIGTRVAAALASRR